MSEIKVTKYKAVTDPDGKILHIVQGTGGPNALDGKPRYFVMDIGPAPAKPLRAGDRIEVEEVPARGMKTRVVRGIGPVCLTVNPTEAQKRQFSLSYTTFADKPMSIGDDVSALIANRPEAPSAEHPAVTPPKPA